MTEYRLIRFFCFLFIVTQCLSLGGCKTKKEEVTPPNLTKYTIAFGGDVFMARRLNDVLFSNNARNKIFGNILPILSGADMSILNAEGVIAKGGRFTNKGEPAPYTYKAHPNVLKSLKNAGIDIVTVGNNHVKDYGSDALVEMLDRLTNAEIEYTGAGYNLEDAMKPAYHTMGEVVVAIVGADLTSNKRCRARKNRAGTFFHKNAHLGQNHSKILNDLIKILATARKRAHVVIFSPHWGANYVEEPTDDLKELAHEIIDLGFDGIVGHSAHWFHGVEIIDGKPVIYDMGNLLIDYGGTDPAHRGFLWELEVTQAGINKIKASPLWINKNRVNLATGKIKDEILASLKARSNKMGTMVTIENDIAVIKTSPGGVKKPLLNEKHSLKRAKRKIRLAPSDLVIDKLPTDAVRTNVEFIDGIRLIGYRLMLEELPAPKGAQIVQLFWTTDKKIKTSYKIHLEARGLNKKTGKPTKHFASHLPGDWMLPTNEWPAGKIIQDWTLFRLPNFKPEGKVEFFIGLWRNKMITPTSSDKTLHEHNLVHIGDAVYKKGAKGIFEILDPYLEAEQKSAR